MRYIICICLTWFLFDESVVAQESVEAAPDAELVKRVQDRTSDVTSAKLQYLHFHFGPVVHESRGIRKSSEEIENLITTADLAHGDDEKFRGFLKSYSGIVLEDPKFAGPDGKPLTLRGQFLFTGQKTREQQDGRVQTFDGADMVSSDAVDNQALIGHPSHVRLRRMTLDDFCTLMSPELLSGFVVVSKDNLAVNLRARNGLAEIVLEQETGLLRRLREYTRDNRLKFEIIQVGTFPHPTIPFPKAIIQVDYSEEQIAKKISASVVVNAEFNVEIPDDAFHHAVQAGVKVVDMRQNPENPEIGFTATPVSNVLAGYTKRNEIMRHDSGRGSGTSRGWIALNLVSLAAVGLLIYLTTRHRSAES
ncbi:MAG: hypothetical protein U0941_07225 [Planctomycetaceae bacterium]